MKCKSIVPVKLNSKRLHRKNVMEINGIPLIEWTVRTLNELYESNDIIVYCSDKEIEDFITSKHTFIKRDKKLDRDDQNIHNILSNLIEVDDIHTDYWVLQHCTSPFIEVDTIRDMLAKVVMDNNPYDSAFAVTKHQKYGWFLGESLNFDINNIGFTQTTEPIYLETSGPFIFKERNFLKHKSRVGSYPYMKVVPFTEGIDIDTSEDFKLAKIIGERYGNHN